MQAAIILFIILAFILLAPLRIAGAWRHEIGRLLARHGLALLVALGAAILLSRGLLVQGALVALIAFVLWRWPVWRQAGDMRRPGAQSDLGEAEARAILGVGPDATAADIRAAFRAKMANAHPDKGGSQNEAARLGAARDRLLKK